MDKNLEQRTELEIKTIESRKAKRRAVAGAIILGSLIILYAACSYINIYNLKPIYNATFSFQ